MWPPTSNNVPTQMQALSNGSGSYNYYCGDGSIYDQSNHQSLMTSAQMQGYQALPHPDWGHSGHNGTNMRPAVPDNINSTQIGPTSNSVPSQMQAPSDGSGNYKYYSGDGSSYYDRSNHQSIMTSAQMQGYQAPPYPGWGQSGHDGTNMRPAVPDNINSTQMQAPPANGRPNYTGYSGDRNSFSNHGHGTNHAQQGQGLWCPTGSSSKALPSPVFRNELSNSQPHMWPAMSDKNSVTQSQTFTFNEGARYNNRCDDGFLNDQNQHRAQGPRTPTQGYQPMQFTPGQRPNFPGYGRGYLPPNHRGGRGARGIARGNGNAPGRGRGRSQVLSPAKSHEKRKEGKLFCDPCDRSFNNAEQLAKHISEHRTCGIDGCKLTAHSSVVEKHVKMQHDTGLFLKMQDMVNSNDFAKWRAERKMRYPSKENIVKRQEEQDEKLKRGESLENKSGRFPRNRGGNPKRGQRRERGGRGRNFRERINNGPAQSELEQNSFSKKIMGESKEDGRDQPPTASNRVAQPSFSRNIDEEQIQDSQVKEERDFSDTEWEPVPKTAGEASEEIPKLASALNTLAAMYDSDSEGESETGAKLVKSKTMSKEDVGVDVRDEIDAPIEIPICRVAPEKIEVDNESPRNGPLKRRHNRKHQNPEDKMKRNKMNNHGDRRSNGFKRKQNVSLLEKLLSSEIRHERNVVLQCIRYIVENNFLQKIEPSSNGLVLANTQTINPTVTAPELSGEVRSERNVLQCIRYIVENNFIQRIEPTSDGLVLTNTQTIKPTVTAPGCENVNVQ